MCQVNIASPLCQSLKQLRRQKIIQVWPKILPLSQLKLELENVAWTSRNNGPPAIDPRNQNDKTTPSPTALDHHENFHGAELLLSLLYRSQIAKSIWLLQTSRATKKGKEAKFPMPSLFQYWWLDEWRRGKGEEC